MTTLADAIYSKLHNTAAIAALVSARIHPGLLPENVTFPAISYQIINVETQYGNDQATGAKAAQVQIDVRCATYDGATTLANLITSALSGFRGTIGTLPVTGIFAVDEQDIDEPEIPIRRKMLQFEWHYNE